MRHFQSSGRALLLMLLALGTARANHITYGDATRMLNTYPPGGNPQLWIGWAVDIRPFSSDPNDPDSFGYDKNLYCENDWHTLAIAEFAHVNPSLNPACDQACVHTCHSCLQAMSGGWLPAFSTDKAASDWLEVMETTFTLDGVPVPVTKTAVKAYVEEGATWTFPDGTIGGYGASFGRALLAACSQECATGFGLRIHGVQWGHIVAPATAPDDPLSAGKHTFGVSMSNGFNPSVTITVWGADAPICQ